MDWGWCMQAWIFAALEDEELRQVYYLFAALYGLPMLSRGFSQDAFSIATVILGLLHIQARPHCTPLFTLPLMLEIGLASLHPLHALVADIA